MSDQLALDESEHTLPPELTPELTAVTARPFHRSVARFISTILSPVVVSLPFVTLVALYHAHNTWHALLAALVTLFFLSVGPTMYILFGVWRGTFTDFDVSQRSQRAGPFLFSVLSALLGLGVLARFSDVKNLETVLLLTAISGLMMMLITFWWKISIHASTLAGAMTMLTMLYGDLALTGFLLVGAVCWSRVVLRRHTLGQVVAGTLLSITLSSVILAIRGF